MKLKQPACAKKLSNARCKKLPKLAKGTYLLRVRALDRAGNASKVLTDTLRLR